MKKKLYCSIVLLYTSLLITAQNIPAFNPKPTTILIPAFLPGIMKDSTAILNNDTLAYNLNIQILEGKGYRIPPNISGAALRSPWETLAEMADAYTKKNKARIIALYNANSQESIRKILTGPQAVNFLDFLSNAAKANLKLVACMQYKNGFLAFTKDDKFGLHQNYIENENGKYKLAALDDKSPTGWNVGLYFKFDPQPMIPLQNINIPDSMNLNATATIKATLPEAKRWIAIYMNEPGSPIMLLIEDDGVNDKNPTPRQVAFPLKGELFISKGTYKIYTSSFNYPIQRVSSNMITDLALHTIKIK